MKRLMSLVLSGIAVIALSGCGSSSDGGSGGDSGNGGSNPTTPEEIATSIVGTWATGCVNEDGESSSTTLKFENSGELIISGAEYSAVGCNAADMEDDWDDTGRYIVGKVTKAADGKDAVELDFDSDSGPSEDYYTMVRFDSSKLLIADGDNQSNNGDTKDKRANDFSEVAIFNK